MYFLIIKNLHTENFYVLLITINKKNENPNFENAIEIETYNLKTY